jgi:hypothetical protein
MQSESLITVLLITLLGGTFAAAEDHSDRDLRDVSSKDINLAWEKPDRAPSKELLEFLVEWETPSGEWISPMEIADMTILESKNETSDK